MRVLLSCAALSIGLIGFATSASAADNAMKVCGAKYQAAKAAKTLPAGETWGAFLAKCRGGTPAATTPTVKPAAAMVAAKPMVKGQKTAAQAAMQQRMQQCAAQWKTDKAAKRIPASQTWPQYWSACSKRLKG
jgi:hypothetical protein